VNPWRSRLGALRPSPTLFKHQSGYTLRVVSTPPIPDNTETVSVVLEVPAEAANDARTKRAPEWVDYSSEMTISKYRALRVVYRAIGVGAIGMGILGYLLPGLPGTVFILIAAYFFGQSSPRFYNWLMNHRIFGSMIRDYRAGRGIPRWVKVYAPIMIVTFSGWSAYRLGVVHEKPWIALSIIVIALYGVWYVLQVPTSNRRRDK